MFKSNILKTSRPNEELIISERINKIREEKFTVQAANAAAFWDDSSPTGPISRRI